MEARSAAPRAVVVCESMFGNTRAVGEAIAEVLATHLGDVDVLDVADAPPTLDDVTLLVVGAPTHAFGMSRPSTRDAAREQGADVPGERGVREWLATLERPSHRIRAAVFDTRVRTPHLPGSAAKAVGRRLRRLGCDVLDPVSFTVTGTTGPLGDGELDRARHWATTLASGTHATVTP